MKKVLIFFSLILISVSLYASDKSDKDWILDRVNIYFENDTFTQTDSGYTGGGRLSALYFIPQEDYFIYDLFFLDFGETNSYFTFAISNQIFTPNDISETQLIVDDRPYAGWSFLEAGIHKSSTNNLRSLSLKVGVIGPASHSDDIQKGIHETIGSEYIDGWDNQLKNEVGVNLKYTHKWLHKTASIGDFEISVVPFISTEVGNVAINATAGASWRLGYNIPKDFGVSSIDIGADPGIPVYNEYENVKKSVWSFSFNLIAAGSVIGKDIFLDGNTFSDSHSVEKEDLVHYYGFGLTYRYKNFVFDFIEVYNSRKFKKETKGHGVGTMVFSWLF